MPAIERDCETDDAYEMAQSAERDGRLHRALALLKQAQADCPAVHDEILARRRETLCMLGRFDDAQALRSATPIASSTSVCTQLLERRNAWQATTPEALRDRANALPATSPERRRLFEQALELAVQRGRGKLRIEVPEGLGSDLVRVLPGPDGTLIAAETTRLRTVRLSDQVTLKTTAVPLGYRLRWIAEDLSIALVRNAAQLRLWRPAQGELLEAVAVNPAEYGEVVAMSSDGRRIVVVDNPEPPGQPARIFVWDAGSWSTLQSPEDPVVALALSPDARWLALGGFSGELAVIELSTGKMTVRTATHASIMKPVDATHAMGFAPLRMAFGRDGTQVLLETRSYGTQVYAVSGGTLPLAQELPDSSHWETKPRRGSYRLDLITRLRAEATALGVWAERPGREGDSVQSRIALRHAPLWLPVAVADARLEIPRKDYAANNAMPSLSLTTQQPSSISRWFLRGDDETLIAGPDAAHAVPWFNCRFPARAAVWIPGGIIVADCREELALGSTSGPGRLATVRAIRTEEGKTAFALFEDGAAQQWGEPKAFCNAALCVVGDFALPLEACEDTRLVEGRLQRLIAGNSPAEERTPGASRSVPLCSRVGGEPSP